MIWSLILSAGLSLAAPVTNKETEAENKIGMSSDQWEEVRNNISIASRADHVPPKPGIERLKDYNATWTITETAPQKVHIVFSAMSNTPPMFPRYIQDPIIEKMFHNNLVRLRTLLGNVN